MCLNGQKQWKTLESNQKSTFFIIHMRDSSKAHTKTWRKVKAFFIVFDHANACASMPLHGKNTQNVFQCIEVGTKMYHMQIEDYNAAKAYLHRVDYMHIVTRVEIQRYTKGID